KIVAMVDKLAKKNILHQNKADNIKSRMSRHLSALS
ncbi:MAG: 30S ribosomal protein S20, partial [Bacteroidales bacterium]|nr:30S ribosomal protein S20 [Bacteroidales bacterium]